MISLLRSVASIFPIYRNTTKFLQTPFPFFKPPVTSDCGPACLYMIAKYYNEKISFYEIRALTKTTVEEGTSLLAISDAAETIGFKTLGVRITYNKLYQNVPLPCIAHFKNHFVIIYKMEKSAVYIADPTDKLLKFSKEDFLKNWEDENHEGIALLLERNKKKHKKNTAIKHYI